MKTQTYTHNDILFDLFSDSSLEHKYKLLLFWGLIIVNMIPLFWMRYPIITDEYTTISEGLYLWKSADWSSYFSSLPAVYYGYGTSILYGWTYHIFKSPEFVYKAALTLNAMMISSISILAFNLSNKKLRLSAKVSFFIAACTALFPAGIIHSKYALNETMLSLLAWLLLYSLISFQYSNENAVRMKCYSFISGALGAYAYTVHGRGIILLFLCFSFYFLITLSLKKQANICAVLLFLTGATIVLLMDTQVKKYILNTFTGTDPQMQINALDRSVKYKLFEALRPSNIKHLIYGVLGLSYYTVCSTHGLIIVLFFILFNESIAYLRGIVSVTEERKKSFFILSYSLLAVILALIVSVIFFIEIYITKEAVRGEYFIYGRYVDTFSSLIIFSVLAFLFCYEKPILGWSCFLMLAVFLGIMVWGSFITSREIINGKNSLSYTMVQGILPYFGLYGWENAQSKNFIILFIVQSLIFLSVLIFIRKHRLGSLTALLLSLFCYSSIFSSCFFIIPQSAARYDRLAPLTVLKEIVSTLPFKPRFFINGTASTPNPRVQFIFNEYQLTNLNLEHDGFDRLANISNNDIIITNSDLFLDCIFDNIYMLNTKKFYDKIISSNTDNAYIYICGDMIKNEFKKRGYDSLNRNTNTVINANSATNQNNIIGSEYRLKPLDNLSYLHETLFPLPYTLTIIGRNLNEVNISSDPALFVQKAPHSYQDGTLLRYTITPSTIVKKLQTSIINTSNQNSAYIQSVTLSAQKLQLANAHKTFSSSRTYIYDTTNSKSARFYRIHILPSSKNVVLGASEVILRQDSLFSFNGLPVNLGTYLLQVFGKNLDSASINLLPNDKLSLSLISKSSETALLFIKSSDYLRNIAFSAENKSSEQLVYYRGIKITEMEHLALSYEYNTAIKFDQVNPVPNVAFSGWSDPESWGTWGIGQTQILALRPSRKATSDLQLTLHAGAYCTNKTVTCSINGQDLSTFIVEAGTPKDYRIDIPEKLIKDASYLFISLTFPEEAVSPAETGESADARNLGIGLYNLMIRER